MTLKLAELDDTEVSTVSHEQLTWIENNADVRTRKVMKGIQTEGIKQLLVLKMKVKGSRKL